MTLVEVRDQKGLVPMDNRESRQKVDASELLTARSPNVELPETSREELVAMVEAKREGAVLPTPTRDQALDLVRAKRGQIPPLVNADGGTSPSAVTKAIRKAKAERWKKDLDEVNQRFEAPIPEVDPELAKEMLHKIAERF